MIKVFGGQIDEFLESSVSYVLTDVPKNEWPPYGNDDTLKRAKNQNIKFMSLSDLINWCSKYISSQSSSDDDDETKIQINDLHEPYLKFEDIHCKFAPIAKELKKWPEVNLSPQLGKSIFWDPSQTTPASTVSTNQIPPQNSNTTKQPQAQNPPRGVKRRNPVYCEICNQRAIENLDEHLNSKQHKINSDRLDWTDVHSVMASVPKLSCLGNIPRITTTIRPTEHHEFLCLHKVETASQLFVNPTSNKVL